MTPVLLLKRILRNDLAEKHYNLNSIIIFSQGILKQKG